MGNVFQYHRACWQDDMLAINPSLNKAVYSNWASMSAKEVDDLAVKPTNNSHLLACMHLVKLGAPTLIISFAVTSEVLWENLAIALHVPMAKNPFVKAC